MIVELFEERVVWLEESQPERQMLSLKLWEAWEME